MNSLVMNVFLNYLKIKTNKIIEQKDSQTFWRSVHKSSEEGIYQNASFNLKISQMRL